MAMVIIGNNIVDKFSLSGAELRSLEGLGHYAFLLPYSSIL